MGSEVLLFWNAFLDLSTHSLPCEVLLIYHPVSNKHHVYVIFILFLYTEENDIPKWTYLK